jgi:hypothetical protein
VDLGCGQLLLFNRQSFCCSHLRIPSVIVW